MQVAFNNIVPRCVKIYRLNTVQTVFWPRGYKTFFMLNSAEHEILNAHKYKKIKKFSFFQAQISIECLLTAHEC